MMHLLAQLACLAGFAALAFATTRTQRDVLGRRFTSATNVLLRASGTILLVAALGVLVAWQGWALGVVMYSGHTSLAAGLVYGSLVVMARRRVGRAYS